MKKILHFVWALAAMIYTSCNSELDVDITPVIPPATTYNQADGAYYGIIPESNVGYFSLDLNNSSNTNEGIHITGYCTSTGGYANFKLEEGTYNLATTGATRTAIPGAKSGDIASGTYLYDITANKYTLITGGNMTITTSSGTYSVTITFTGTDATTGASNNDIRINYTGGITFADKTTIERSTYTATGIPRFKSTPGPTSWSGTLEPVQGSMSKWFNITNWCNLDISVSCDYLNDGSIRIDNYIKVFSDNTHDFYFRHAFYEGNTLTIYGSAAENRHIVHYNPATKVLDFSGIINNNGKDYEALVGIVGYNKSTGEPEVAYSDFYANLKLQLTPVRTTSFEDVTLQKGIFETPLKTSLAISEDNGRITFAR